MDYKYSQYRKKHQRALNKQFRRLNKGIENDDLWRGRFVAIQDRSFFIKWEDNSGYYLMVEYHFIDKKNGQESWRHFWDNAGHLCTTSKLWWDMNDFIVNESEAWKHERDDPEYPDNDKTDYRNINVI